MRLRHDREADALSIRLSEDVPIARTDQIDSGTLIDLDDDAQVVAIEVIHPDRAWIDDVLERYPLDPDIEQMLRSRYPNASPSSQAHTDSADTFSAELTPA